MAEDGKYIETDYFINKRALKIFFAPLKTDEESGGIMAVLHDVTQQKRLDDARKEFVANVSHELRTPLTNIKGYTETLLDAYEDMDGETRNRFLNIIYSESDRMTRIVKDLLTLTKKQEVILVISGTGYLRVKKVFYFKDKILSAMAEKIRQYNESLLKQQIL